MTDDFQNALQAARRKSLEITEFLDLASTAYDDLKDQNQKLGAEALALQLNRDSLEKERRQLQIEIELLRHANSVSRTSNLSLTIDLALLQQANERRRRRHVRLVEQYNARPPADELAEREIERLQRHLKRVRKSASAMAKELAEIRKQPKPCKCAYHRFPDGNSFQVVCPEHASIRDWEVTLRRDIDPHRLKPAPLEKAPAPAPEGFRVGKGCDCLCGCWLSEEGSKHECGVLETDLCAPCCDENDL